jgi:lysyl-tRNA synthetase class 2
MSENHSTGPGVQGSKGSGPETRTSEPQDPGTPSGSGRDREIRLAKLAKLREAGVNPYAYRWDRTHTAAQVRPEPQNHRTPEPRPPRSASPAG